MTHTRFLVYDGVLYADDVILCATGIPCTQTCLHQTFGLCQCKPHNIRPNSKWCRRRTLSCEDLSASGL